MNCFESCCSDEENAAEYEAWFDEMNRDMRDVAFAEYLSARDRDPEDVNY